MKLVEEMRKAEQKSQTLVKADIGRLKCFVNRRICRIYIVGSSFWEGGISFLKEGSRYQETIRQHAKPCFLTRATPRMRGSPMHWVQHLIARR